VLPLPEGPPSDLSGVGGAAAGPGEDGRVIAVEGQLVLTPYFFPGAYDGSTAWDQDTVFRNWSTLVVTPDVLV
jgi:hypothetical protein